MTLRPSIIGVALFLALVFLAQPRPALAAVNCSAAGVICKSGTLAADEVWSPGNIYVINGGGLTIPAGRTLTIQAGTIVKVEIGLTLEVFGVLNANGTAVNRVYFTSVRDDTVGGDTDNSTTQPAAGNWDRVYFRDGSSGTLAGVEFRYGGDSYNGLAMLHVDAAAVTVDRGVFKNSDNCAIASLASHDVTFTNMGNGDLTGSLVNGQCIRSGALSTNATWDETEVSYVVLPDLTVASGSTLTWAAGIVVKMWDSVTEVTVDGVLNATGTANSRVYVTSVRDDAIGGSTDNQAVQPAAGNWDRVYFRDGSAGTLNYVEVRYGGDSFNNLGAIHVNAAAPMLANIRLYNNAIGLLTASAVSNPSLTGAEFLSNTSYGVLNLVAGHWITAAGNWWGNNSGPYDPIASGIDGDYNNSGTGDRVSNYVSYRPWVGQGVTYSVFLPLVRK